MSDQVNANPEEIRIFAQTLEIFNGQLSELVSGLNARLFGLGESWRDREFEQFKDVFEQTVHGLNRFLPESERYVRFLHQKAEHLERFLEHKL